MRRYKRPLLGGDPLCQDSCRLYFPL
jgi:hypothetical protein